MEHVDHDPDDPLWIFAYGSLMWRPDFAFAERTKARLGGYHRSLCIASHHYRGTPERPGLVLGLDRGGSCLGVAFRIPDHARAATLAAVRARELISGVYRETTVQVVLADGRRPKAITYVADRSHDQYAGKLDPAAMLERVRAGIGQAGPNVDYVRNTHLHLAELGISDPMLAWLVESAEPPARSASGD